MPLAHIRKNRLSKGLCAVCGVQPFREGKTTCQSCVDKRKAYSKVEYAKRKGNRKDKPIKWRQKIIDKGLCLECLEPIKNKQPNQEYCNQCSSNKEEKKQEHLIKVYDNETEKFIYIKESLVGQILDKLTILDYSHCNKNMHHWVCQCECGNIKILSNSYIKRKDNRSCGECDND